jgi:signal transduction histidine kinase
VRCETSEKITELPSHAVHHLKRIAQEAITNAIKHAGADSVILQVEIADDGLALSIADDGAGFDTTAGTRGTPGHFGCMGIRERCRKIGATVEWESEAGKGTRVRVKMPIPT